MAITHVSGACGHDCPDTCALITEVNEEGRAVRISGDPEHSITRGWLCAKVNHYLERVYHPERLKTPLRRVGQKGEGRFTPISWEEAIGEIGKHWRELIARYGAETILPYSYSGTLGLVHGRVCNERLWNRMGASQLERTICSTAGEEAVRLTLGSRLGHSPEEIALSKTILLWGSNPASTAPHLMPFLRQAQRNGAHVVVIDPHRTLTARSANQHIQPYPGTDAALALSIAHVLITEGFCDETWLAEHSTGFPAFRARAAEYPPQRAAEITQVSAAVIYELARRYGSAHPAHIRATDGVQRNHNGGSTVRAIAALPALAGQYGKRGGGFHYSTSGWVAWDPASLGHVAECPPPGRSVNMNQLGEALLGVPEYGPALDPPIMGLYVFNANPAASAPDASKIAAGLRREDLFTVVHELFQTDTADYADILLPATSQIEQADLHKPYGHLALQYNTPAIAPLGQAKSNWDVMRLLATEMGYEEPWLHQNTLEVIEEVLTATATGSPYLEGITLQRLQREGTVPLAIPVGDRIPFASGRFPTPSGKIVFYSAELAEQALDPLPGYHPAPEDPRSGRKGIGESSAFAMPASRTPLALISPAAHNFLNSSFSNIATLQKKEHVPQLELHPADAALRGINDGDWVRVENSHGWCRMRAVLSTTDLPQVPPGVAATTKTWWPKHSPEGHNVNWLTSARLADLGGCSTFHSTWVEVRPEAEENP